VEKNVYDKASRYAAALNAVGFLSWLFGLKPSEFIFHCWHNTRSFVLPKHRDRTGDSVAEIAEVEVKGVRWLVPIEFQTTPDLDMPSRMLEYIAALMREIRKRDSNIKYQYGAGLVNLEGHGESTFNMVWPNANLQMTMMYPERNLAEESADQLLKQIEAGQTARELLVWIPLLQGAGESSIIKRWKAQAELEPDYHKKGEFAALSLVFAGRTKHERIWTRELEDWNVEVSTIVESWIAKGVAKGEKLGLDKGKKLGKKLGESSGRKKMFLEFLQDKFDDVPADLRSTILKTKSLDHLQEWSTALNKAQSLKEFRKATGL
jgi:hypothetical protein